MPEFEIRISPPGQDRFAATAFMHQVGRKIPVGPTSARLVKASVALDGSSAVLRFQSDEPLATEAAGVYDFSFREGEFDFWPVPAEECPHVDH